MRKIFCETCPVRDQSIIADLAQEAFDDFRAAGISALYRPRQVVFHEGTRADGLYVLCHGRVKLYQSDRFGHNHVLGIASPGDVLGELPLDDDKTYSTSAEALTESQLCYLQRDRLIEVIQLHPMIGVRVIAALSRALAAARIKARDLALKDAESRLAELLLEIAGIPLEGEFENVPMRITLTYSRREIAEMIGVSTETTIRLLGRMRSKQLIKNVGRDLVIPDPSRLVRIANHGSIAA